MYSTSHAYAWPVEPTMEGAFESFAIGVRLTEHAYSALIRVSGAALSLDALKTSLNMGPCPQGTYRVDPAPAPCHCLSNTSMACCPCPANWTYNGTDCRLASCNTAALPACDTPAPQACDTQPLTHSIPLDVTASSVYKGFLNKSTGAWNAGAKTGWIEFSFPVGTLIGNMSASFNLSPQPGYKNTLTLDGHQIATWDQPTHAVFSSATTAPFVQPHDLGGRERSLVVQQQKRPAALIMNWSPTMPISATKLRLTTSLDVAWVSYG
jgi:hypothetical protein